MKKVLIIMFLAVAGLLGRTFAQTPAVIWSEKSGWHKIGEKVVDLKMERDELLVMGADKFSALKFKVTGAPIEILEAKVHYESDEGMFDRDNKDPGKDDQINRDKGLYDKNNKDVGQARDVQNIAVNSPLQAGTETRVFELTQGQKEIEKISFRYKTLPNATDTKARIEIWGFKTAVKEQLEETKPEM
jgi:hypothetical protein